MTKYVDDLRALVGKRRIITVGSTIIIYRDGKILLQKRMDDGTWDDHGGCVELGEKVEDAARRELTEETGLVANKLELFGVYSGEELFHTYPDGNEVAFVIIYWLCNDFSGELKPQADEVSELRWFDIDDMPTNLTRSAVKAMADFTEKYHRGEL